MKHIVCYSGGHSSAIVAIEVVRKFGKENTILINHECKLEPLDVDRFERQVSDYLELPITYVSFEGADVKDQFDVVMELKTFVSVKSKNRSALCTHVMKTEPFMKYLNAEFSDKNCIVYYGFDMDETKRIQRRSSIMAVHGYKTDYPLALWKERTIFSTKELNITPPNSYEMFKHANCIGCLKAGWQHWYCVFVNYPDIYEKGILSENTIGYKIHKDFYLEEMIEKFELMIKAGIVPTEHINPSRFWSDVKKKLKSFEDFNVEDDMKPCECFF